MKIVIAAFSLFVLASCKATTNTLARWGGAGVGAVAGSFVGPVGAGVGAVAGDALGDSMVEDPPTTEINNSPGGTIYAQEGKKSNTWLDASAWLWMLVVAAAFRFREHLWNAASCLFYGGWKEALSSIFAIFVGGKASHKATATAGRLKSNRKVGMTTLPHAMPPQSK